MPETMTITLSAETMAGLRELIAGGDFDVANVEEMVVSIVDNFVENEEETRRGR